MDQIEANLPVEYVHEEAFDHLTTGDEIATQMLDERDQALLLVDQILNALTQLNTLKKRFCPILGETFEGFAGDVFDSVSANSQHFQEYREVIRKKIDGKYWNTLLDASRCTTLMNASTKKTIQKKAKTEAPPFEMQNVIATINEHNDKRFVTFVEAGVELFESLNRGFKSNDKICQRKKLILNNALFSSGWSSFGGDKNKVHDFERVLMILDGKDPAKLNISETAPNVLARAKTAEETECILSYFDAKLFNNGNVHLILKRPDLVDKFNGMLAHYYGGSLGQRTAKH